MFSHEMYQNFHAAIFLFSRIILIFFKCWYFHVLYWYFFICWYFHVLYWYFFICWYFHVLYWYFFMCWYFHVLYWYFFICWYFHVLYWYFFYDIDMLMYGIPLGWKEYGIFLYLECFWQQLLCSEPYRNPSGLFFFLDYFLD